MTDTNIGIYIPDKGAGGSVPIPELEGLHEIAGVEFRIINLLWISPTDDYNLQTLIEQALKDIIKTFTINDEQLCEEVVTRGIRPRKQSTAMIMLDIPFNQFKLSNMRKSKLTTAEGRVGFIFKKDLDDAVARRKLAPQLLADYFLKNPYCIVDIPDPEP